MRTREYGTAGLRVSPIGLKLAAVGRPGYITTGRDRDLPVDRRVAAMRDRARSLLDAAAAAASMSPAPTVGRRRSSGPGCAPTVHVGRA